MEKKKSCSKEEIDWCIIWKLYRDCSCRTVLTENLHSEAYEAASCTVWTSSQKAVEQTEFTQQFYKKFFSAASLCNEPETRQGDEIQISPEKSIMEKMNSPLVNPWNWLMGLVR